MERRSTRLNRLVRIIVMAILSVCLVITMQSGAYADTTVSVEGTASKEVVQISSCDDYAVALLSDGTIWEWGALSAIVSQPPEGGTLITRPEAISEPSPLVNGTDVRSITVSPYNAAAVKNDGSLWMWGANDHGQLMADTGDKNYSLVPVKVEGISDVAKVYLDPGYNIGNAFAAITSNGDLYVWGCGTDNEIMGEKLAYSNNYVTEPTLVFTGAEQAAFSDDSIAVIDKEGKLWTWGDNNIGTLGTGGTNDARTPVQPAGLENKTFKSVRMFNWHCYALTDTGEVWSWGRTDDGNIVTPVRLDLPVITDMVAGNTLCAIDTSGSIWAMGTNNYGQCGQGSYGGSCKEPVIVTGHGDMPAAAGTFLNIPEDHYISTPMVLMPDGNVWGWGAIGGLGDAVGPSEAPSYVGTPSKLFSEVTRGWTSSGTAYFVMSDGTLWAAGGLTGAPESGNYPKIGKYKRVYFGDKPADPGINTGDTDIDDPDPGSGTSGAEDTEALAAGSVFKYGANTYKVGKKNTVALTKTTAKTGSVSIPSAIKKNGVTYKVTSIGANAFKGRKISKVTIGANVSSIGKNAFYNCKKLKSIVIKTSKLSSSKVGAKAFKGTYKKAVVKVPAKKRAAYKKWIFKKGLSKSAKVK